MSTVFKKSKTKRDQRLFALVKEGSTAEVESLIAGKGRGAVNSRDEDNWTPLSWASFNGHIDIIQRLVQANANINAKDKQARTPLYLACNWGSGEECLDIVKYLIESNAQVNVRTTDNSSALHLCALRGKPKTVKLLLDAKADILQQDAQDRTPIEMARVRRHKEIVDMIIEHAAKLLWEAADTGDTKLCIKLLENQLVDVNSMNSRGMSALHYAIKRGNEELVKTLLENNASPTMTGDGTPLYELAEASNNPKIRELFSEDDTFIPYHGILHSVKKIKKKGNAALKQFSAEQQAQCLASKKLQSMIPQVTTQTPKEAVFVAIGCILTRNTIVTEKFRSGEWSDCESIINELENEKQQEENEKKARRRKMIEESLLSEVQTEMSAIISGKRNCDSFDEFNYRERTIDNNNIFDEFILQGSKSKIQSSIDRMFRKSVPSVRSPGPVHSPGAESDDPLDAIIAEAEASVRAKNETN